MQVCMNRGRLVSTNIWVVVRKVIDIQFRHRIPNVANRNHYTFDRQRVRRVHIIK